MPRAMSHKPSPSRSAYAISGLSRDVKSYRAQKPALVSALSAQSGTADEREAHCARTVLETMTRIAGRKNARLVMVRLLHQFALRTASMKLRPFVSTHEADTAALPMVPSR